MSILLVWVSLLVAAVAIILGVVGLRGTRRVCGKLPPSPPSWPIIGHLHLLATSLPHRRLAQLANTYGPVIFLRFGSIPTLVVSSPAIARLFLQLHDKTFSDRPDCEFRRQVGHGKGMVLTDNGEAWRDVRRICSTILFHPRISQSLEGVRMAELGAMVEAIAREQATTGVVNIATICVNLVCGTMSRLLFTDPQHTKDIKEMSDRSCVLLGTCVFGDYIRWLRFLDHKVIKEMRRLELQIDSMFRGLINLRQIKGKARHNGDGLPAPDFLDAMLYALEDQRFPSFNNDESIIDTCRDILIAGTETTSTTMEWCMAELLANPNEMKRLEEEIDMVVPSCEAMVTSADVEKMSYLKALVKETMRLHPPAPYLIHQATSSSSNGHREVGGYIIPPNTRVMINLWAMGRDPSIWKDPLHFCPQRFLDGEDGAQVGNFRFIPFGSGRRRCPGSTLALTMIELGISNLVRAYRWILPPGYQLDMEEKQSITNPKLNPLLAVSIPRR